jgi:hypothetical protein
MKVKNDIENARNSMLDATRRINRNPLYKDLEESYKSKELSEIEKRKRHL